MVDDAPENRLGEAVLEFEWDKAKRKDNNKKHGIDFARARRVFLDPDALVMEASHKSEERLLIVGRMEALLITVVFTMRGQRIRIISARHARRSERKRYGQ